MNKKDGTMHKYNDYIELNKMKVKNHWTMPNIDDLFDKL